MFAMIVSNAAGVNANSEIWYKDLVGSVILIEYTDEPDVDRYRVLGLPKYWTKGAFILKEDIELVEVVRTEDTWYYYA